MAKRESKKLTAVGIDRLGPGRHGDGNGLYLEVDASGARRWMLRTVVEGRRRDIGLGGYSKASNGLAKAREQAEVLRVMARSGGNPLEARRKKEDVPTFEAAATAVHESHSPSWKNQKHRQQWLNTLKEYAFPLMGSKRVDAIETSDVLRVLSPVWLAKPETARRVRQRIKVVMDWAKAAGHRSGENPVDGVSSGLPKHRDEKKHHASLPYTQTASFVESLRESNASNSTKRAFEFLILAASRVTEVVGMKKQEIDFDSEVWTCPAERMKAKKSHRVPLTPRMVKLLELAVVDSESDYVFAGLKKCKPLSNMAFLMHLRRLQVPATVHGFRSAFRVWAAEMTNHPREVAELALAHVNKDRVEAAYQRSDLFLKRRKLMEDWTAFVTTPVAETAERTVALPQARHADTPSRKRLKD